MVNQNKLLTLFILIILIFYPLMFSHILNNQKQIVQNLNSLLSNNSPNKNHYLQNQLDNYDYSDWSLFWQDDFENSESINSYIIDKNDNGHVNITDVDNDGDNELFLLHNEVEEATAVYIPYEVNTTDIHISLKYRLRNESGVSDVADGFVIAFYKYPYYTPTAGGALGFYEANNPESYSGYGVEFDLWSNPTDPDRPHIALINGAPDANGVHFAYKKFPSKFGYPFSDSQWHKVEIFVVSNYVFVKLDGTPILGCWLPEGINREYKYIGITAATGGAKVYLAIDDLVVRVRTHGTFNLLYYDDFDQLNTSAWLTKTNENGKVLTEVIDGRTWVTLMPDTPTYSAGSSIWFVGWNSGYIKYDLIIEAHFLLVDNSTNDADGFSIMFYKDYDYTPRTSYGFGETEGWGVIFDLYQNDPDGDPGINCIRIANSTPFPVMQKLTLETWSWGPRWRPNGAPDYDGLSSMDWEQAYYALYQNDTGGPTPLGDCVDNTTYTQNEELYITVVVDNLLGNGTILVFVYNGDPSNANRAWWIRLAAFNNGPIPKYSNYIGFGAGTGGETFGFHIDYVKIWVRDTAPPHAEFKSIPKFTNKTEFTVEWNGSDDLELDHYEIKIDNGEWVNLGLSTSYHVANLTEGVHTVYLKAVDKAGNYIIKVSQVIVDFTNPTVEILFPTNNTYLNTPDISVKWICSDNTQLSEIDVKLDDMLWVRLNSLAKGYTFTGVPEGIHTVYVKAYDAAGNCYYSVVTFAVDLTSPKFLEVSLSNDSIINKLPLEISWKAADNSEIKMYRIYIDKVLIRNTTSTSVTLDNIEEGIHTITIEAVDLAGNTARVNIAVTIDSTPPKIISVVTPSSVTFDNTLEITVLAEDNVKIVKYIVYINGKMKEYSADYNSIVVQLDKIGMNTIKIIAVDKAGNSSSEVSLSIVFIPFYIILPIILGVIALAYKEIKVLRRKRKRKETKKKTPAVLISKKFNVEELEPMEQLSLGIHRASIEAVSVSPDGKYFATAGWDMNIAIWRTINYNPVAYAKGHTGTINDVEWSPDGSMIASASVDMSVKIWDTNGLLIKSVKPHTSEVTSLTWSPDGKYVASGGADSIISIIDIESGKKIAELVKHANRVNDIKWSPDGKYIASCDENGLLVIWNAENYEIHSTIKHRIPIVALSWDPEGKYIAFADKNGNLSIVDVDKQKVMATIKNLGATPFSVSWSPKDDIIAVGLDEGILVLVKPDSKKIIARYKGHEKAINAVSWFPDGERLVSVSKDASIAVWDIRHKVILVRIT